MKPLWFERNRICSLFGIGFPIIQAGMVWVAGWKLCAAVSKAGALGLIGAGSMKADLLREHIQKARAALADQAPFGVNIPLQRKDAADLVTVCVEERVRIVFTSAGNPALFTGKLKEAGVIIAHVVPTAKLARKAEERGVDAVVCEGTEAGGHDGVDEIPTFVLIPQVRDAISLPLIAADAIEFIIAGASAVAIGTASFVEPACAAKIIEGIKKYCIRHKITNIKELTGALSE